MKTLGLTLAEAQDRLKKYGPNQVKSVARQPAWRILLEQFQSPLVIILILACVLSAVLGEWLEVSAIGAILVLNALIGFFQEYRAESAVQALMRMTAPKARVVRDRNIFEIPATDVVPGDVLVLEAGDIIAADGRILDSAKLQVNEAVLTGESVPVEKSAGSYRPPETLAERSDSVFMGTSVSLGTARVEVSATGMGTELGKIAHLIGTAQETQTPLQVQMARVGRMLLVICLAVVFVVALIGVLQDRPWIELIVFSISLAVAAVPEGLPVIVTVALAVGVQRMAARNALIRKLPSVETLGSVNVICTDKTGTLTTGKMRVREVWGQDHLEVLKTAAACCDATLGSDGNPDVGDTTEIAILIAARERDIERERIETENPRLATEPFDSDRKRMSVSRADGRIYVKGALESLLPLCTSPGADELDSAIAAQEDLTSRGLRVLAVARGLGSEEKNLTLLGLVGIADPPRTEVMQAITEARQAGIRPIMITGDHPTTAAAIARELGLVRSDESLDGRVHARATPEDKLQLVRKWKDKGSIVAMTGDGVNDAPALREAHIGIAMGQTGTEVTRQSADLILSDDNFATIVSAIKEGRTVYRNIRSALQYLLIGNFAELMAVLGASLLGLPIPFMAAHLLWINLVTDALPGLTLIAEPVSSEIMREPPRSKAEQILGAPQWIRISVIGAIEALSVMVLYWIVLNRDGVESARNLAFTTLVMSQLLRAFSARSPNQMYWQVGALSNLWMIGVVGLTLALQLSLHFIPAGQSVFGLSPISADDFVLMAPFALITATLVELSKLVRTALKA